MEVELTVHHMYVLCSDWLVLKTRSVEAGLALGPLPVSCLLNESMVPSDCTSPLRCTVIGM